MTGTLLRRGSGPPHFCEPPFCGTQGDVWRCDTCRRRWTCKREDERLIEPDWFEEEYDGPPGPPIHEPAQWDRRYWPWPLIGSTAQTRRATNC